MFVQLGRVFLHDRIQIACRVKHILDDDVALPLEAFPIDPNR